MESAPRRLGPVPALVGAALGRVFQLPPRRNKVTVERDLRIPMRDGTVLLADHYAPVTHGTDGAHGTHSTRGSAGTDSTDGLEAGPRPTVLMRCPYGRGLQFATFMGQPYAERGYHVLIQSVRGTFGSGGVFLPGVHEAADGQDTVAWLRTRDWFDGRLATVGASYLGYVQWALALDPPPELKAMIVHIGPHDLAESGSGHGPYELYNLLMWSELMHSQERYGSLRMMWRTAHAERRLAPALERLPLRATAADFAAGAPWYDEWLDHPDLADPFWDGYRAPDALDRVDVPVLLISGLHDFFLEQTLQQYRRLVERDVEVGLTLGPWTHLSVDPHTAVTETLAWLDAHVDGRGPAPRRLPVRVWVGGAADEDAKGTDARTGTDKGSGTDPSTSPSTGNADPGATDQRRIAKGADREGEWRELAQWPPAGAGVRTWYLGGGATLSPETAAEDGGPASTSFRYDPADPTPNVGGRLMASSGGSADNSALEARDDVLTFTGPALDEALEVMGAPSVELYVSSDNPHGDLFVRLCDVDEQGCSFNLTDQILRLPLDDSADSAPVDSAGVDSAGGASASEPAAPRLVTLQLLDTAHRFRPGHRIRLQISGGAHPRYARNMGTAESPADAVAMVPVTHSIHHGAAYASCLALPVLKDSGEDGA